MSPAASDQSPDKRLLAQQNNIHANSRSERKLTPPNRASSSLKSPFFEHPGHRVSQTADATAKK